MKSMFITATLLCLMSFSYGQKMYFGAGSTVSGIRHFNLKLHKQIGYFVGVSSHGDLKGPFLYSASVQFVNQKMSILDSDIYANAMNASFYYGFEPIDKFSILAGMQMGYIIRAKFENAELKDINKEQMGWTAGVAYDLSSKFKLESRYIGAINSQLFDYTVQIGVNYGL